jgi:DNA mismatch repair ATPase MutS
VAFDYLLKPGKLTSFNAIKILKMSGYPDAVIQDAYDTISQWTSKTRLEQGQEISKYN